MVETNQLGRTVRWTAALSALSCGLALLVRLTLGVVRPDAEDSGAGLMLLESPQVLVFALAAFAGVALCYGRIIGYTAAGVCALLAVHQYYFWFQATSRIKESASMSTIHGAAFPGNYLIGADILDLVPLVSLVLLITVVGIRTGVFAAGQIEGRELGHGILGRH